MTMQKQKIHKVDGTKVNAWLDEHWKGSRACPICGNTRWGTSEDLVEVRHFSDAHRPIGDEETVCPLVLVVCETCSYTMLFSAIMLGLVEKVD